MAQTFHITPAATFASLDETRTGKVAFTVTNASARPVRAYPEIKPLGSTQREWLEVEGQAERAFSANEVQVFTVNIRPPAGVGAGQYEFKLNMINADKADVDGCTEGPAVQFKVEGAAPPPPPKRLLWIALAALVVLIGGAVVVLLWPKPKVAVMPALETKLLADVEADLVQRHLPVEITGKLTPDGSKEAGYIWHQEPPAGVPTTPDTKVVLTVETASYLVPEFRGKELMNIVATANELTLDLNPQPRVTSAGVGKIVDQNPQPQTRVPGGTKVDVWIGVAPTDHPIFHPVALDATKLQILKKRVEENRLGKAKILTRVIK